MRHRQLPTHLRERVRRFVQYKWLATRGVDEESILRALPADLRRDIQRHLCLDLVRRVCFLPFFYLIFFSRFQEIRICKNMFQFCLVVSSLSTWCTPLYITLWLIALFCLMVPFVFYLWFQNCVKTWHPMLELLYILLSNVLLFIYQDLNAHSRSCLNWSDYFLS